MADTAATTSATRSTTAEPDDSKHTTIRADLRGVVDRLQVKPKRDALLPLYEAVSNALYAIVESKRRDGSITIELTRNPAQGSLAFDDPEGEQTGRALPEITAIKVADNGVGFTPPHFEAFEEFGSRYKFLSGGKGVGRCVWLKAFEEVLIESVYRSESELRRRSFSFSLLGGVEPGMDEPIAVGSTGTTVTMSGLRPAFAPHLRHRGSTIARELTKRFLPFLLGSSPPGIVISDGDERIALSVEDVSQRERSTFSIAGETFAVDHLRLKSPNERQHAVHFCAANSVVRSERLKELPSSRLVDDGEAFYYQAYVSSQYLDANANTERTGFAIDEDSNLVDEVSFTEIRSEVQDAVRQHLGPLLVEARKERDNRIDSVFTSFPELGYIANQHRAELDELPIDVSETDIEDELARIHFGNQKSGRKLLDEVIAEMRAEPTLSSQAFVDRFEKRLENLSKVNQASLLSYMLFRRSILEIYAEVLKKSDDKFQREAAVHNLIFPMGRDHSTTEAFVEHNLWLIDERLTYANYIASDKALSEHRVLYEVDDKGEPDIVAYFNLGFSTDPAEGPLHSVVIVEFKRPGPLKKRKENPYQQVLRYVERIRDGFYNESGQKVKASEQTMFYCYIVCDVDEQEIKRLINEYQFKPLFSGEEGYFLYNDPMRAYVELRPFEKILRDAKRNHRAFFDRMGLSV